MIKDFLYKIKTDLNRIYFYPEFIPNENGKVDYYTYWQKRKRGDKSKLSNWQKQRADYLLELIEPGANVLDVGCGDGAILKYLKDMIDIKELGFDIDSNILSVAEAAGINVKQIDLGDYSKFKDLPNFDYIIGLEIIEHMPSPEEFIFALKNKCQKAFIFSIPNSGYYVHRLRLLFGKFPLQWVNHPGEHLRFWTVKDVKWWTRSIGFKIDRLIIYEGLKGMNKLIPNLFGQGMIIKITKSS